MVKLTDESFMPFGRYKGTKLANVPAEYLLWLHGNGISPQHQNLKDYIEDNMDVLKQEIGKVKARYPKYTRSR